MDEDLQNFDWDEAFSDDSNFSSDSTLQLGHGNMSTVPQSDIFFKNETFLRKIDEDLDYQFALCLQTQYNEDLKGNSTANSQKSAIVTSKTSKPLSIVDEQWELIDPHPDVHALFLEYDSKFFYGKLKGVEVRWSSRMTLCAGVCSYEGRGGLCSIRLSLPLLKFRPRRDLVETLLHEMIHAFLFVTHNNKDRESHGPEFLNHMNRINKESGTKITVYHTFHDEVDLYKQHWWKCDGPCKDRHPFYGLVKRAMNRAPGPNDTWWSAHQASCGGKFVKIKEPDNYKKAAVKRKTADSKNEKSTADIRSFLKDKIPKPAINSASYPTLLTAKASNVITVKSLLPAHDSSSLENNSTIVSPRNNFVPFQGSGNKLGGSSKKPHISSYLLHNDSKNSNSGHKFGNTHSTSSNASDSFPRWNTPKISKVSASKGLEKGIKDPVTQSSVATNGSNKLTQSPMDKFLISKSTEISHLSLPKTCGQTNVSHPNKNLNVKCPICFVLVKESEINPHIDICLNN